MTNALLIKCATQLSDFARYTQLQQALKDAWRSGDALATQTVGQQIENLKNRYGGYAPPGRMPQPDWQVTVQSPARLNADTIMPGYVQVDDMAGGRNSWSRSPATLAQRGIKVPAGLEKLPQGRYTMLDAARQLWTNRYQGVHGLSRLSEYPMLEKALQLAQYPATPSLEKLKAPSMLKSWRRYSQRINPEFNQAFRRIKLPLLRALT